MELQMPPWVEEISPEILPEPYRKLSELIGVEATLKLAHEYQGTSLYFAKLDTTIKQIRDKKIRYEHNGRNIKELAIKFGLTEVWVRQILNVNQVESNQMNLFEISE